MEHGVTQTHTQPLREVADPVQSCYYRLHVRWREAGLGLVSSLECRQQQKTPSEAFEEQSLIPGKTEMSDFLEERFHEVLVFLQTGLKAADGADHRRLLQEADVNRARPRELLLYIIVYYYSTKCGKKPHTGTHTRLTIRSLRELTSTKVYQIQTTPTS